MLGRLDGSEEGDDNREESERLRSCRKDLSRRQHLEIGQEGNVRTENKKGRATRREVRLFRCRWEAKGPCVELPTLRSALSSQVGGMASLLLTCASAFINEFEEKSIGEWLRRCVALSLEKGAYSNRKDFLDEVLRQINMPIRNRQVNKNDSNN